jgi:hypothetical protein
MRKEEIIQRLEVLRDAAQWEYDVTAQRHSATADDYTLVVERRGAEGQCGWLVKHARYGELMAWTPCLTAAYGKRDALDFTRSHVLGHYEPQHAEG